MSDIARDNSKRPNRAKNLSNSGSFGLGLLISNEHHAFVVKKSEKLASALYVVTGFIPPEEPVRTRLRVCALNVIGRSADQSTLGGAGVESFAAACIEIGTILETAKSGGLVSAMNAELIHSEYVSLASFVREHEERISERGLHVQKALAETARPASLKGHYSNKSFPKTSNKIVSKNKGHKEVSDRTASILDLLKSKEKISIKDAVESINGVSEKTLQRELLSLVKNGTLIKEGERRWSTYRKAPTSQQSMVLALPSL
jgi:hypothetical protein